MTEKENQVQRRAVFYLSGYDPRGARHYHELYKEESAKQGELAGYVSEVGPRRPVRKSVVAWDITFKKEGGEKVETEYHFLDYSGVIRKSWRVSELAIYKELLHSYIGIARIWSHLTKAGMFRAALGYSWPIMFASLLPLLLTISLVTIAALTSWAALVLIPASNSWKVLGGVLAFVLIILSGRILDKKLNLYWMLRAISFVGFQKYADIDGAEELWDSFGDAIYDATEDTSYDEVLVVGHSVGSVIGLEVLSRLLEKYPDLVAGRISFVTLGGTIQFPASDPKAQPFHRRLVEFCFQAKIDWVDLGARVDGACFSCVHPFWVMPAQVGEEEAEIPRLFPVKFFESFSAQGYKDLKKDRLKLHFQYLQASELGCGFDYFLYVSGGQRLESHFPKNI